MTVELAIWTRVASLPAVTAIASSRVYLEEVPASPTYPAVLVQLVDDPQLYHCRGPQGQRRARIQVDALVQKASGVDAQQRVTQLAEAIDGNGLGRQATGLSGFIGTIGSPGVEIQGCFRADRRRRYDPEELRVLTISLDYFVTYTA